VLGRLVLEPPREQPAELRAELDASLDRVQRRQARAANASFAAIGAFLVAAAWNGVTDWPVLCGIGAYTALLATVAFLVSRGGVGSRTMLFVVLGNAGLAALLSRVYGSLIVAPGVTCVMAVSLTSYPRLIDRGRIVIAILVASWVLPIALELAGALESTWHLDRDHIASMSQVVTINGASSRGLLVFANRPMTTISATFANALARSRRDAQRKLEIQAWHLRQLVPDETVRSSGGFPSRTP
jgi:serine/threonine-protein kinase